MTNHEVAEAPVEASEVDEDVASNDATRYLCAGAYVHDMFAEWVVTTVFDDRHRAVAPSYGVDIAPVIRHCVAARSRRALRDVLVIALYLGSLLFSIAGTLLWTVLFALPGLAVRNRPGADRPVRSAALVGILVLIAFALVLSRLSVALTSRAGPLNATGGAGAVLALAAHLGILLVLLWDRLATHQILMEQLQVHSFDPQRAPSAGSLWDERIRRVATYQQGNVTVHSGYDPFVGAGQKLRVWSMALELDRPLPNEVHDLLRSLPGPTPDDRPAPQPFTVSELHAYLAQQVQALSDRALPDPERVPSLRIRGRVFVEGLLPSHHWILDKTVPRARLDPDEVARIMASPQGRERYYQEIRVGSWDEEVVVTLFVHAAVEGRMLYVEFVPLFLPPVRDAYHVVDRLLPAGTAVYLHACSGALLDYFRVVRTAPGLSIRRLVDNLAANARAQRQDRMIAHNPVYEYGATTSVRELGTDTGMHNYFQQLDAQKYTKLVERRVIGALLDFLESKNVDTSEYRVRMTAVLNQGVMVGGSVSGSAVAAAGAMATVTAPMGANGG